MVDSFLFFNGRIFRSQERMSISNSHYVFYDRYQCDNESEIRSCIKQCVLVTTMITLKKFMQCYYSQIKEESNVGDRTAVALELVKGKIVDIFLDEVKATYTVIK